MLRSMPAVSGVQASGGGLLTSFTNRAIDLLCQQLSTLTMRPAGVDWTLDSKLHFWDLFTLPDESRLVWEEHARRRATGNLELRLQCALGKGHSDCLLRIR